jgi:hypothetical protein
MKIRDAVQVAAEAVLSELLVPNAAKELACQIGERAETHVIAAITGDASSVTPRAKTAAHAIAKKAKAKRAVKTKPEAKPEAKRRKPRQRTNGVHAQPAEQAMPPVTEGNVVPINGTASVAAPVAAPTDESVQTEGKPGLGL